MFVFAGVLLASGIFIARPYCRFLCPYGVLLNWFSRFSFRHMTITPSNCIQCKLCEHSCPYDAIRIPVSGKNPDSKPKVTRKFITISMLIPVLMFVGGLIGSLLHESLATVHPRVRLARDILDPVKMKQVPETYEIKAFRSSGKPAAEVLEEAKTILHEFYLGSWIFGIFIGLTVGLLIANRLITNFNPDYVPDKGNCYSCARCMEYCPV
jgi:ferredoxin